MQRSSTCRRRPDGNSEYRQHDGASDAQPAILGEEARDLPRPHPCKGWRAYRCANMRFRSSLATITGEVMCSREGSPVPADRHAHRIGGRLDTCCTTAVRRSIGG
jgi:hypothetical protein